MVPSSNTKNISSDRKFKNTTGKEGRQQYRRKGNKAMGETQEEIFGSYFPPILFS